MTGGYYFNKKNKHDVALNNAIEKLATKNSRSKSDVIRQLLWVAVEACNTKKTRLVSEKNIPANNPLRKFVTA